MDVMAGSLNPGTRFDTLVKMNTIPPAIFGNLPPPTKEDLLVARPYGAYPDRLIPALQHEHPSVRRVFEHCLGEMGPGAKANDVKRIAELSQHRDIKIRTTAARTLGGMGIRAVPFIELLCVMLEDRAKEVREAASKGIIEVSKAAREGAAVSPVIKRCRHEDWWVRVSAAETLGKLSSWRTDSVPSGPLVELIKDKASPVRKVAAEALQRLPPDLVHPHEELIEKQRLLENIPAAAAPMHVLLDRLKAKNTDGVLEPFEEARRLFMKADKNNDGAVEQNEIRLLLTEEGVFGPQQASVLEALLKALGKNPENRLEQEEWVDFYMKECSAAEGRLLFSSADGDGNGELSKREIKRFFCKDGELRGTFLNGGSYKEMYEELDADGDGVITLEEWISLYVCRTLESNSSKNFTASLDEFGGLH